MALAIIRIALVGILARQAVIGGKDDLGIERQRGERRAHRCSQRIDVGPVVVVRRQRADRGLPAHAREFAKRFVVGGRGRRRRILRVEREEDDVQVQVAGKVLAVARIAQRAGVVRHVAPDRHVGVVRRIPAVPRVEQARRPPVHRPQRHDADGEHGHLGSQRPCQEEPIVAREPARDHPRDHIGPAPRWTDPRPDWYHAPLRSGRGAAW